MARRRPDAHDHPSELGFIAQRDHPFLPGQHVVGYVGEEQGLDTDGGRYTVVCEAHGETVAVNSKRMVAASLADPEMFCSGCQDAADARSGQTRRRRRRSRRG